MHPSSARAARLLRRLGIRLWAAKGHWAATVLVIQEDPKIAGYRSGNFRQFRNRVFVCEYFRRVLSREQECQFLVLDAGQIEIEIFVLKRSQFEPQ